MNKEKSTFKWHYLGLAAILFLSVILNFYKLGQEGIGNTYYSAAVKSMLESWHNFFFNSFDPKGFITIDKPPVGFWLQTLSAFLFGFKGWSLFLPQALAGVLAVALLYHLVSRVYGRAAGLLAALFLAVTPIVVAADRTNEVDSMLMFVTLLATWALSKSAGEHHLRWLVLAFFIVGIGFNVKMMEAFLVLPAFYVFYLLNREITWKKKIGHLLIASVVLMVVSLSWSVIVDSVPANERPYVGSTQNNSEVTLAVGYNGINRLVGQQRGPRGDFRMGGQQGNFRMGQQGSFSMEGQQGSSSMGDQQNSFRSGQQQGSFSRGSQQSSSRFGSQQSNFQAGSQQGQRFGNGNWAGAGQRFGGNMNNGGRSFMGRNSGNFAGFGQTGNPGPFRLFTTPELDGQLSWILPGAFISIIALLWGASFRKLPGRRRQAAVFWTVWVLTMFVFFSVARRFSGYYMVMLAPGIAALAGAGFTRMWREWRAKENKGSWLLPLALVCTVAFQISVVWKYPSLRDPLSMTIAILAVIALIGSMYVKKINAPGNRGISALVLLICALSLVAAPAAWAMTPIEYGGSVSRPFAGPELQMQHGQQGMSSNPKLESYLEAHYQKGTYLAAALNAMTAAPMIIDTGLPVMAMGGFMGSDPAISVEQLQNLASEGQVCYFLLQGRSFGNQQSDLVNWIQTNCVVVPTSQWQGTTTNPDQGQGGWMGFRNGSTTLYEYVKR